ncbi:MAG: DUF1987 domain-containing protein [Bacteroidales bacterium]
MDIQSTSYTPKVYFDSDKSILEISGRSFPENAKDFYVPIIDELPTIIDASKTEVIFRINLEYFNTSSSKFLLQMLQWFEQFSKNNQSTVTVEWWYVEDDEDMKEAGEEYEQIVDLPFSFIEEKE